MLDRVLHRYERRPVGRCGAPRWRAAERWILDRQEADGSWGGIQPPWVYSLIALHLTRLPARPPGDARRPRRPREVRRSTTTAVGASRRASRRCGTPRSRWSRSPTPASPPDDPALVRAADWLLGEEVRVAGDWAVRRPRLAPGGWAFEFANDNYPDVDDTAEVVLALAARRASRRRPGRRRRRAGGALGGRHAVPRRRLGRLRRRQHQPRLRPSAVLRLRRGDDPPSADVTAHVRRDAGGRDRGRPAATAAGVGWLRAAAGARRLVVRALGREPRLRHGRGAARAASRRTHRGRGADAGRGPLAGDAPERRRRMGRGPPLVPRRRGARPRRLDRVADRVGAARAPGRRRALGRDERGVRWLVATQRADGTWDEP